jgi:hypothetical protein
MLSIDNISWTMLYIPVVLYAETCLLRLATILRKNLSLRMKAAMSLYSSDSRHREEREEEVGRTELK